MATTTVATDDIEKVWDTYKADMSRKDLRNLLVERYMRLVKYNDIRSEPLRTLTSSVVPSYLCPTTPAVNQNRTSDALLGDFDGDGGWTEMTGEEMACIDYMGISGPSKNVLSPSGMNYVKQLGILVDIEKAHLVKERHVRDGSSHTIMVAESASRSVFWDGDKEKWELSGTWASGENTSHVEYGINEKQFIVPPPGIDSDPEDRWAQEEVFSYHAGGVNLLFVDGHVQFMPQTMSTAVLCALASRDGERHWGETPELIAPYMAE